MHQHIPHATNEAEGRVTGGWSLTVLNLPYNNRGTALRTQALAPCARRTLRTSGAIDLPEGTVLLFQPTEDRVASVCMQPACYVRRNLPVQRRQLASAAESFKATRGARSSWGVPVPKSEPRRPSATQSCKTETAAAGSSSSTPKQKSETDDPAAGAHSTLQANKQHTKPPINNPKP